MNKLLLSIIFALLFCGFAFAQDTAKTDEKAEESVSVEPNKPLKILKKPRPRYPTYESGGTVCVQGTVTLRIQFLATGEIGKIAVISGLPYGLTENAIEAAKGIEFEPAVKNSKPITVTKIVPFSFTIY